MNLDAELLRLAALDKNHRETLLSLLEGVRLQAVRAEACREQCQTFADNAGADAARMRRTEAQILKALATVAA